MTLSSGRFPPDPRRKARFREIVTARRGPDRVIGDRSIAPLIRLGLLEQSPDLPVRLLLTERGRATWLLFCQRGGRYPEDLTDI